MGIILLWWILFMSHHEVHSKLSGTDSMFITGVGECSHDKDCGSDYYCLAPLCEPCIPCEELFNRKSPFSPAGETSCARNSRECGSCLPGSTVFELTRSSDDVPSFACVYAMGHNSVSFSDLNFPLDGICLSIVVLVILLIISTFVIGFRRKLTTLGKKIIDRAQKSISSDPPPYSEAGFTIAVDDEGFASIPRPPPYSVIDPRLLSDDRRHASLLYDFQSNAHEMPVENSMTTNLE